MSARRCTSKCKATGKRCRKAPINGGNVCQKHGGGAPQVKAAAKERIRQYVAEMVDPDRLLQEAARLALSDITQLFDERGGFKPMKDWPEHIRAAASSVEVVKKNLTAGDGHVDEVLKIKVWDKPKNIELLFKHLGLLDEKVKVEGGIELRWRDSE